MLVARHLLGDGEATELKSNRAASGIGRNHVARKIENDDPNRTTFNTHFKRGRAESHKRCVFNRMYVDRLAVCSGQHGPGSVLGKTAGSYTHSDNIIAQPGNSQRRRARPEFNYIPEWMRAADRFERGRRLTS